MNKTQEALKMAIAYAQDVKRGSAIVPTYHDVIINACKEELEENKEFKLLKLIENRAKNFPNYPIGYHIQEIFAYLGEEQPNKEALESQEPYKYLVEYGEDKDFDVTDRVPDKDDYYPSEIKKVIPLYTHPAQPLSDEKIILMAHNDDEGDWPDLRFEKCWHKGYMAGVRAAEKAHGIGL